jgi:predicted dehydrogenase
LGFSDITLYDTNELNAKTVAAKHNLRHAPLQHLLSSCSTLIIAAPPHTHFDLLTKCIQAKGKKIICEKPFLFNKQEAEQVVNLSNANACTVMVAHLRRCFTAIEKAHVLIPQLSLGNLQKVTLWEGGRFSYKPKSDYTTQNLYGGVLLDTGSHVLDCLLHVTGLSNTPLSCKIIEVRKDQDEPAHEVYYQFLLNNITVDLSLSRYKALANKMVLYYEQGIIEIPLGLKPNIIVTTKGKRNIYSSEDACLNYMSEAFKLELQKMLIQQDISLFGAQSFVQLSRLLETLYNA